MTLRINATTTITTADTDADCGLDAGRCNFVEFKNLSETETVYVGWDGANADIPIPPGESYMMGITNPANAVYTKAETDDLVANVWVR